MRDNLSSYLKKLEKDRYMLVSHRGKVDVAIVDIDFFEDLLSSVDKKYLESIKRARKQYENGEYYTFEEVFGKD